MSEIRGFNLNGYRQYLIFVCMFVFAGRGGEGT